MSKKVVIFPPDYQASILMKYAYLGDIELIEPVSSTSKEKIVENRSRLDNKLNMNMSLYMKYKQKFSECDIVYFVDNEMIEDKFYNELIAYAKSMDKEVIVNQELLKRLETNVKQTVDNRHFRLLSTDVPIVSVFEIGFNCQKFETELALREYFVEKGYKVLHIGLEEYSKILGVIPLPQFLFDVSIEIQEKIVRFNEFIYNICQEQNPDVIILGVPQPILKYNDDILNGLGVLPYIIQNGITSDIGVVNLPYAEYSSEYLSQISQFCKYRLGIEVKYFGVSNVVITQNVDNLNELEYLYIDDNFVECMVEKKAEKEDEYITFTVHSEGSRREVFRRMEQELLNNPNRI